MKKGCVYVGVSRGGLTNGWFHLWFFSPLMPLLCFVFLSLFLNILVFCSSPCQFGMSFNRGKGFLLWFHAVERKYFLMFVCLCCAMVPLGVVVLHFCLLLFFFSFCFAFRHFKILLQFYSYSLSHPLAHSLFKCLTFLSSLCFCLLVKIHFLLICFVCENSFSVNDLELNSWNVTNYWNESWLRTKKYKKLKRGNLNYANFLFLFFHFNKSLSKCRHNESWF